MCRMIKSGNLLSFLYLRASFTRPLMITTNLQML
ncbi:hypothetical protein Gogos_017154, partial [Gossypium gossypioides]|nr:hypothetical protein [Gossypium gossypioides]MBA0733114.1 hypothetical protein [Gossypium gossypioides]